MSYVVNHARKARAPRALSYPQLSVRQCISHLKSRSTVNISCSMFSDSLSLARKEGAFYVHGVQGHNQAVFFPREANGKGNRSECLHEGGWFLSRR